MKTAIGIDIGGTNIKGVLINENGKILQEMSQPTNDNKDGKWKEKVFQTAKKIKDDFRGHVDCIGLASPGLANDTNEFIAYMPDRLSGLENFNWSVFLNQTTHVLNDAHAALLAEASFGTIKGFKNAILLTLGTGVGGGLLINGELFQGMNQMAGHFGHISINTHDDEQSILGMPGSLEYALGNYSVNRRSHGRYENTDELVNAYLKNEPLATWLWLDLVRKLSIAIASFSNSISPEIVVLTGGITHANQALFEPLKSFLDIYEFKPNGNAMPVVSSKFSDLSGAVGAAAFAFKQNEN
jgi:glucokinase